MRNSLKIAVLILCTICLPFTGNAQQTTGKEDRAFWVENLTRIADPVLVNLSNNTLKKNMPYESLLAFGGGGPSGLRYRSLAGTGTGQYA
jgi:hypothetical protein